MRAASMLFCVEKWAKRARAFVAGVMEVGKLLAIGRGGAQVTITTRNRWRRRRDEAELNDRLNGIG